jgi:hypothetical protein
MTGPEFFQTRMGMRFFEATAPKIADQLERLNANLEALVTKLRLTREARGSTEPAKEPQAQK